MMLVESKVKLFANMTKRILKYTVLALVGIISVTGCIGFNKVADLRTERAMQNQGADKAKALLKEMALAHGSRAWQSIETYSIDFEDEFYGFIGKNGHPFKDNKLSAKLDYIPYSFDGQLTFKEGKLKDQTWGIQSGKTYTQSPAQALDWDTDKDIKFWLPTYQYFTEFPLRIQNADALAYAGEHTIDGVLCQGILASWQTTDPQKDIDQYLIWISKADKRIVKLAYTVREQYKFLTGAAYYKDYKNYDGIWLPSRMPVESNLVKKGLLHEMRILDFKTNVVPVAQLRPDTELPVYEDAR